MSRAHDLFLPKVYINLSFQFFNFMFNSSGNVATMKRSLAYNSTQRHPVLNSSDRASITMIQRGELSIGP